MEEAEDDFAGHTIGVGHGKGAEDVVAGVDVRAEVAECEVEIAPQGTVRNHDALRESCSTTRIVDDGKAFGRGFGSVDDVLAVEACRIAFAEELVEVLVDIGEFLAPGVADGEVRQVCNASEVRHLFEIDVFGHAVTDKKKPRFAVVDDIVYLFGLEFALYGYHDASIGKCGEEGYGPVGTVAAADSHLVTRAESCGFHADVELGNAACHVAVA